MKQKIEIENSLIGENQPCFIIGEIGSNHNRDKNVVRKLIDACSDGGFNAVKFQIYDAEEAFSKNEMTTDVKLESLYGVNSYKPFLDSGSIDYLSLDVVWNGVSESKKISDPGVRPCHGEEALN